MRHLLPALAVLLLAALAATNAEAVVTRTTIGDVPRTFSHFMNAQEAALCRANAAAGGLSSYFFNPAAVAGIKGISGRATMRMNFKTRDYLPEGATDNLEASDDVFLFSQAVAAKRDGAYAYGFGYSCPSYRRLELTGDLGGTPYSGDFTGGLRFFEILAAARVGSEGRGAVGLALGIGNLDESANEKSEGFNRTADMSGFAASVAFGATFEAMENLVFGGGYRLGTSIDVEGEWNTEDANEIASGTTKTEPVAVVGVRYSPIEPVTLYGSYINEGWDSAESSFAAYYPTEDCVDCGENDGRRNEFDGDLSTLAFGAEGTLLDGRLTLRAGYSVPVGSDFDNDDEPEYRELVPESAFGFGGTFRFGEYSAEAAFVMESYADGEVSEVATNNGLYVTLGYDF